MPKNFTVRDLPKTERPKNITRQCAICGKDILVKVFSDGKYSGGNYFHSTSECNPNGQCPDIYKKSASRPCSSTSSRHNSASSEYWECERCYRDK